MVLNIDGAEAGEMNSRQREWSEQRCLCAHCYLRGGVAVRNVIWHWRHRRYTTRLTERNGHHAWHLDPV